jgi:hydroxymethylpyrimidine/phosphomethylpyrimidine kinase
VRAVHPIPPELVVGQVAAVAEDIGVDAVKVGMLGTVETILAVERALELVGPVPVVLDPVMVAESGAPLLEASAREALRDRLLPRASVATPNLPEARALTGVGEEVPIEELARAVRALGPSAVVVTGGHAASATDVFDDGGRTVPIPGPRHADGAAHGSGCTHSSSLAALLALGIDPLEAALSAREIAAEAVGQGLRALGGGAGPVDVIGLAPPRPVVPAVAGGKG